MFKDFSSLHPLAVHFPIVLILLAAAFQAVLVIKDWKQIRWATFFIMAAAFISALAASTILHAEPSADAPKAAIEMFEEHEKYASLTLWMSGITLLLKSIGIFFKLQKRLYEVIVLIAAIIAAVFLSIAGHHGARLTHIAGVGPMGRYLMKEHGMGGMDNMDMKSDSTMQMKDSMPAMKNMPGMDTMQKMKSMDSMSGMKDMGAMKTMDKMKGMDNMKGMEKKKMSSMKDMKNMPGMTKMKNMKGMENMKGMDTTMKMDGMKDMKGMNDMKDMKNGTMNMPGMNMPEKNAMDTIRFPDNNPVKKKKGNQ